MPRGQKLMWYFYNIPVVQKDNLIRVCLEMGGSPATDYHMGPNSYLGRLDWKVLQNVESSIIY